jgi:MATE family multidrug resistance protein
MVLFPRAILSAYVDVDAPERAAMVALAMRYLIVAAAFQLVDATQAIIAGALRGLQDTRVPMLIAMLGYWLPGFGTSLALGFGTPLRGFGIWIGLATGLRWFRRCCCRWRARERLGLLAC